MTLPLMRRVPLLAPLLVLAACSPPHQARTPLLVQTAEVGMGRFSPSIDVVSKLESTTNVAMRPEADGRVVRILAVEGQRVRAGQRILELDNVQESAALNASQAEADKDRINAERYVFLNQQGAVSAKDMDFYITQAIKSRDQVRASAATLGYKFVTAPIAGELGALDTVKLGDYVRQGEAITGITDNSTLWTLMDIPATQANQVRIGQTVQLQSQGDAAVTGTGRVVFISPYYGVSGSSQSPNTVLVKASFPNLTGRLKTGQYVKNRIVLSTSQALSVPVQAVMFQAQQPFVYRVFPLSVVLPRIRTSEQIPEKQKQSLEALPPSTPIVVQTPVQLGTLEGNRYPVLSGLQRGDRIVTSNTALLRSGMPVRVAPAASNR